MKDLPGDDCVHENDVVCDYSVASSPTKSSKEEGLRRRSIESGGEQGERCLWSMPIV